MSQHDKRRRRHRLSCLLFGLLIALSASSFSWSPSLLGASPTRPALAAIIHRHHHHQHHYHHHHRRHHKQQHRAQPTTTSVARGHFTTRRDDDDSWSATFGDMIAGRLGRSHVATTTVPATRRRSSRSLVNLAVDRLRILESLDDQLAEFASKLAARRQKQPQTCQLPLEFPTNTNSTEDEEEEEEEEADRSPSCLSSGHLRRQIPAYMLNLHTKLQSEAHNLREALRLMPYKSVRRMRSFRQPPIHLPSSALTSSSPQPQAASNKTSAAEPLSDDMKGSLDSELVVELNVMQSSDRRRRRRQQHQTASGEETGRPPPSPGRGNGSGTGAHSERSSPPCGQQQRHACDLSERLRPARDRTQLCYAFRLTNNSGGQTTATAINGSLGSQLIGWMSGEGEGGAEKLIEAELHLFKLEPDPELLKRHQATSSMQLAGGDANESTRLRTNLLEVSLYQILAPPSGQRQAGENQELRLLDIRRIDLHSSGWESFYVKRAVQDWLADWRSNLGLVIKAKSMFDEPIRLGLLRFADLYDHRSASARASEQTLEFDLSHQPALVVYTGKQDLESNG